MSVFRHRLERLTDHAGVQWGAVALAWLISALTFQLRPIMPIDETRYLSIAWEMWHSGQWWVAHMNGVPYADKPPLLFWLINLGWAVFGVNDWWPRMIMPLASLLGLFQLRRIALSLGYGSRTAQMALLVLMSMLMWWLYSATLMFDVLLTTCLLGAVAALVSDTPLRRRAIGVALWLALALLALFSLVSGKQVHYLMPILPPLALIIADILTRPCLEQRRTLRVPAIALFVTGALTLSVKMVGSAELAAMLSLNGVWLLWGLTAIAVAVQLKTTAAATVLALITTTALASMLTIMLAPLWPRMDTQRPAHLLSRIEQQGQPVVWYGRDYQASFQFAGRLTTPLQTINAHPTDLCRWRQSHPAGWVIADSRQLPALYVPALAHRFPWRARTLLVMPVSALQIATPLFLCLDPL